MDSRGLTRIGSIAEEKQSNTSPAQGCGGRHRVASIHVLGTGIALEPEIAADIFVVPR